MSFRLLFILVALTAVRLFICGKFELSADEAYYYQWSQHPDLSYYSKGPMIAMTILASTKLWGITEFGVRFFSPLLSLGASFLTYALVKRLYGERTAFWAAILQLCLPIYHVGSLLMTIDSLSIFFWVLTMWSFWRALEKNATWSNWWLLTGLAIGAGALSKFTNLATLLSMVIVLGLVPAWHREWRRPGIYVALAISLASLLPVIIWNRSHGWITWIHLKERSGAEEGFHLNLAEPFNYLSEHLVVYTPLIFLALMGSFLCGVRYFRDNRKTTFLMSFALPLLVLYGILSLNEAGEANWTAPGLLSLGLYATHDWLRRMDRRPLYRWVLITALVAGALFSVFVVSSSFLPNFGINLPTKLDPSRRVQGWKEFANTVAAVRREVEAKTGSPVFLITDKYQVASELAWYLPEKPVAGPGYPPVFIPESQMIQNQYSFWPSYDTFDDAKPHELDPFNTEESGVNRFVGKNALYLVDNDKDQPAPALIRGFERWEYFGEYEVRKNGINLRKVRFFICYNYKTLPL